MTARLLFLLIPVKATEFEKVTLGDMQKLFVNTITAYEQYSALNREYLTHPIHIQLSQKEKTFWEFFLLF